MRSKHEDAKMLKEDLGADEDQRDAAGQRGLVLEAGTELVTDHDLQMYFVFSHYTKF